MCDPAEERLGITEDRLDNEGGDEDEQVGLEPQRDRHDRDPRMIRHGGQLSLLRRRFPDAPAPLIDLSTGINPFPYPVPPIPETAYTRLPETVHIRALKEAAAAAYGARDPDLIAVAPGTQILISSLPRIFPAERVVIRSPAYGEFAAAWDAAGATVVEGRRHRSAGRMRCRHPLQSQQPRWSQACSRDAAAIAGSKGARGGPP